jgi:hypothetical protein
MCALAALPTLFLLPACGSDDDNGPAITTSDGTSPKTGETSATVANSEMTTDPSIPRGAPITEP